MADNLKKKAKDLALGSKVTSIISTFNKAYNEVTRDPRPKGSLQSKAERELLAYLPPGDYKYEPGLGMHGTQAIVPGGIGDVYFEEKMRMNPHMPSYHRQITEPKELREGERGYPHGYQKFAEPHNLIEAWKYLGLIQDREKAI